MSDDNRCLRRHRKITIVEALDTRYDNRGAHLFFYIVHNIFRVDGRIVFSIRPSFVSIVALWSCVSLLEGEGD